MKNLATEWPELDERQVRQVLKLAREKAGIRPRRRTLSDARKAGFMAGFTSALKYLAELARTESAHE